MAIATEEDLLARTFRAPAETAPRMPQPSVEFPAIVPAPRPVGWIPHVASWLRVGVSVGISLAGHAGVLAWLGYLGLGFRAPWIPVQSGQASIELTASLASTAAEEEPEDLTEAVRIVTAEIQRRPPVPPPETDLSAAPTEIRPRPAEPIDLPRAPRGNEPDRPQPAASEVQVELDRRPWEVPPPEVLQQTADAESCVARADRGRRHAEQIAVHASVDSLPSPASQASLGAESSPPGPVYNPAPGYPPEALAARQAGRVVLRVGIAPDGTVVAVSVHRSSGVASLDAAALEAVGRWRFAPADSASAPMRWVAVPIRFVIEKPATSGN